MSYYQRPTGRRRGDHGHSPPRPSPPPNHPQYEDQPGLEISADPERNNGVDMGYMDYANPGRSGNVQGQPIADDHDGGYRGGSTAGRQNAELFMDTRSPSLPRRPGPIPSNGPAVSGYRHQYQNTAVNSNQPTYNPQDFAAPAPPPPPPHAPQSPSVTSSTNRYTAAAGAAALPQYNPAAYQTQPVRGYSSGTYGSPSLPSVATHDSYYSSRPQSQHSHSPDSARPMSQYSSYQSPYSSQVSQPYSSPSQSTPPSYRYSAYAPPAAPPPPVPPSDASASPQTGDFRPGSRRTSSQYDQPLHSSTGSGSITASFSVTSTNGYPPPGSPVKERSSPQHQSYTENQAVDAGPPYPPPHNPQRSNTTGRHPQSRPLPTTPHQSAVNEEYENSQNWRESQLDEDPSQRDLWKEVEAAVMDPRPSSSPRRRSPRIQVSQDSPIDEEDEPEPLFSRGSGHSPSSQGNSSGQEHLSASGNDSRNNYDAYSSESDAEAAYGVEAMRLDQENNFFGGSTLDNGDKRRNFGIYGGQPVTPDPTRTSFGVDEEYPPFDMRAMEGGPEVGMSYGNDPNIDLIRQAEEHQSGLENTATPAMEDDIPGGLPPGEAIHPFRPFESGAKVNVPGTGGLIEPGDDERRMSFDEGDEKSWSPYLPPGASDQPEQYYQEVAPNGRPLPPVPPHLSGSGQQTQTDATLDPNLAPVERPFPTAPDSSFPPMLSPNGPFVPRSASLSSYASSAQTYTPVIRSKTDAEEQRRSRIYEQMRSKVSPTQGPDAGFDQFAGTAMADLDLPSLPTGKRKRFHPSKLSTADFNRCTEPWALSAVATWLKDMSEGETDLKSKVLVDGVVALFTHKVPTMNVADAETLSEYVIQQFFDDQVLIQEEEWVKFGPGQPSGVMWQITGMGCYSPRLHLQDMPGRCYSHHCSRTLRKVNLQSQLLEPQKKLQDWATFYKLTKEDVENVNKKEIERQNNLHEIVQTEDQYIEQLNLLRVIYRDQLQAAQSKIINQRELAPFLTAVFGKVDSVKKVNEDHLLAQLKYRQQEQGPWIRGFSDIFREWIRKARGPYLEYSGGFPKATALVRRQAEINYQFRVFLDQARENERSKKLDWSTYLKAPITRLQRYSLLLATVLKNMVTDNEEKARLQIAIEEIRNVTFECDARLSEESRKADLMDLQTKLVLRQEMGGIDLQLEQFGRELIFQGDLQRTGAKSISWLEVHALLFDHYFVLAKKIHYKDSSGGTKHVKYDVSKHPIPMDLLVLESASDEPVVKSVRGIGAVTAVANKAQGPGDRMGRATSNHTGMETLTHTNTDTSMNSTASGISGKTMVTNTVLENPKDEKVMYPFRVKHLGREVYTLYAPSALNRNEWCSKIIEAKTRHAASLFAQNAEPFRLHVIADTAFAYENLGGNPRSAIIHGTPLDRAIRDVEKLFEGAGTRASPVCRAAVNCATAFLQPYGKPMFAVGTDFGVYFSDVENPRGWSKAISATRVTQIAVMEEFNLFLVIADRSLIAYHLDVICPVGGAASSNNDSSRKAPQKLSGSREVGFFAMGRMKDRALVFYKKREGISSTFKVLEPVYAKATEKRSRFIRRGHTDVFREFDEFYIPSECYGINLFHSSMAISTAKGFEVLTLDKKQGWAVPDLKPAHVGEIASQVAGQKPLGMFRLNDTEFLLCYEDLAVYVSKHGDISRSATMKFVGSARSATLCGPYVLLFDSDFVEIRNADNGRLRQVIPGRDVKCLDDGGGGGAGSNLHHSPPPRSVKISLQHPEFDRTQIVVELLLNEGQRD